MIGKIAITTKNPPCNRCGGMAGYHSKDCPTRPKRLNDPQRGDMWTFASNYGQIVRHVKSVTSNGTVSYTNNGRFTQCSMATWRRWARGAELNSREKW